MLPLRPFEWCMGRKSMRDGQTSPMPYLERRFGETGIIDAIEEISQAENPTVELAECAYHMGYPEEAAIAADAIARDGDELERIVAQCLRVVTRVALNEPAAAYDCILEAESLYRGPFADVDDVNRFGAAYVCARIIEDCTLVPFAGLPNAAVELAEAPLGLQAYCGFQIALRALQGHEPEQAIGIARSFLAIIGDRYPVSATKLRLVMAAASLRLGAAERAVDVFEKAWNFAKPLGIVMPFVELSAFMPGLIRHCLHGKDEASYLELRSMIRAQRAGWHALRERLHLPVLGAKLSILEYCSVALVIWGWSNRETARFLGVAENTVKHYLTNAYQKLGVKNRGELSRALAWDVMAKAQNVRGVPETSTISR
ncbi:MAG: hypothetical protein E7000_05515 [Coriobacteriaceae bacterium]|nr:hypothetical protein [Coriobacteriaceae bacterium]